MTLSNFIPEVWAMEIAHQTDKALVAGPLCNRAYEGLISAYGDRVRIPEIGRVTARQYTGATITWDAVDDKLQTLLIDQAYYATQTIDDIDRAQSVPGLVAAAAQEIAYALSDKIDADVLGLYGSAGTTLDYSATGLDSGNVVEIFTEARAYASEKGNVPRGMTMVAVVDPWTARAVKVAMVNRGTPNQDIMTRGFVAENFCGFDVYESNNLTTTGTYAGANLNVKLLAFTRGRSIALAVQKSPTVEAMRRENLFADGIRSLTNWGRKVIRPDEVVCINALINAETGV